MPYLSEGYSEATVDEDAVRKLTEFGDDYGSAIGNPIRLPDPSDSNNNKKTDTAQSHKKTSKVWFSTIIILTSEVKRNLCLKLK